MAEHERPIHDDETFESGVPGFAAPASRDFLLQKSAKPKKPKKKHRVLKVLLGLILVCVVAVGALCAYWLRDMPDCSAAEDFNRAHDTEVYANDHTTLLARFQM